MSVFAYVTTWGIQPQVSGTEEGKINSDSSNIINSMTEFIKLKMEYLQFGSVESHIMKHGKKAWKGPHRNWYQLSTTHTQTQKYNKGLKRDISRNIIKPRDWPNHFKIKEHLRKAPQCHKPTDEFVPPASTVKELAVKRPLKKSLWTCSRFQFSIYFNLPGTCNFFLTDITPKKIYIYDNLTAWK